MEAVDESRGFESGEIGIRQELVNILRKPVEFFYVDDVLNVKLMPSRVPSGCRKMEVKCSINNGDTINQSFSWDIMADVYRVVQGDGKPVYLSRNEFVALVSTWLSSLGPKRVSEIKDFLGLTEAGAAPALRKAYGDRAPIRILEHQAYRLADEKPEYRALLFSIMKDGCLEHLQVAVKCLSKQVNPEDFFTGLSGHFESHIRHLQSIESVNSHPLIESLILRLLESAHCKFTEDPQNEAEDQTFEDYLEMITTNLIVDSVLLNETGLLTVTYKDYFSNEPKAVYISPEEKGLDQSSELQQAILNTKNSTSGSELVLSASALDNIRRIIFYETYLNSDEIKLNYDPERLIFSLVLRLPNYNDAKKSTTGEFKVTYHVKDDAYLEADGSKFNRFKLESELRRRISHLDLSHQSSILGHLFLSDETRGKPFEIIHEYMLSLTAEDSISQSQEKAANSGGNLYQIAVEK